LVSSGIEALRYRVDGTLNVITTLSKRMLQPSHQDKDGRNSQLILNDPKATIRYLSVAPNPTSLRSGIEALRYRVDGTLNVITTVSERMLQPSPQDIDGRNSQLILNDPKPTIRYRSVSPNPTSLRSGIEALRYCVDGTLNVITTLSKRMSQPCTQVSCGRKPIAWMVAQAVGLPFQAVGLPLQADVRPSSPSSVRRRRRSSQVSYVVTLT
jgi:hypothetical protein